MTNPKSQDLVSRLRAVVAWVKRSSPTKWRDEITYDDIEAVSKAADEIERLTKERDEARTKALEEADAAIAKLGVSALNSEQVIGAMYSALNRARDAVQAIPRQALSGSTQ